MSGYMTSQPSPHCWGAAGHRLPRGNFLSCYHMFPSFTTLRVSLTAPHIGSSHRTGRKMLRNEWSHEKTCP